jgi:micrococcal nuclease
MHSENGTGGAAARAGWVVRACAGLLGMAAAAVTQAGELRGASAAARPNASSAAAKPNAASAATTPPLITGTVTRINDGDSLEVDTDVGHVRVRLSAVDTPEHDQPHGDESSAFVRTLVPLGASVELEVVTRDQFRRMVAVVWLVSGAGRSNVNERLLREGHAWAYRRYMRDPRYCDLEAEARARKAGLWARPVKDWVYPPEWRLLRNGEIRALPEPYEETRERCLEVHRLAGAATYEPPG